MIFEDSALKEIDSIAIKKGSGARGLRAMIENILNDTMYEMFQENKINKCIIELDSETKSIKPKYIFNNK